MILLIPNVTVPSGYEYVSGTVNDADTTFIVDMIIEGLCLCSCEESSSYNVVMNFYDAQDNLLDTETRTITQNTNKFVIDRTQADVDYAKNLKASGRANANEYLKGCLNVSDIQRVLDAFTSLGVLDAETLTVAAIPDFPGSTFFASWIENLEIIKECGYQLAISPIIPVRPINTWQKWNDLEKILLDNFDIRTSRFKYFGPELSIRENNLVYPFIYAYQGVPYVSTIEQWSKCPLSVFDGYSIVQTLEDIENVLGYEYVEEER